MVKRLGLTGTLERTLRTTNIIENLMSSVEGYTRRVKRWRGGGMIQRWVASALVEAEPRFRRMRGYRDLRRLVAALDALASPDDAVADVAWNRRLGAETGSPLPAKFNTNGTIPDVPPAQPNAAASRRRRLPCPQIAD